MPTIPCWSSLDGDPTHRHQGRHCHDRGEHGDRGTGRVQGTRKCPEPVARPSVNKTSYGYSALYAMCPYYLVLYTVCKVSVLLSASYAMCPYYVVLYMQSVRIIWCFICKVSIYSRLHRGVIHLIDKQGSHAIPYNTSYGFTPAPRR